MELTIRDLKRLQGVNERLVRVVVRAAAKTDIPFNVSEGLRTIERQKQMVAEGKSKTMQSKHLHGLAVDLYPLTDDRKLINWSGFDRLAKVMKEAARELGVTIYWGGDWKIFVDKPHWELDYPK